MAQYRKQIQSNEIPQLDLAQNASPFLLNVPQLLYPQESPKQEAPKPKAAPVVCYPQFHLTFPYSATNRSHVWIEISCRQ